MADYIIELCPESSSFLGKSTPSTEYANDFSKTPGTVTSGDEAAGIPPSPTAALPKSHLKITVSDGPAPPSPGSAVDVGSHGEGDQGQHVSGIRPSAPGASETAPAASGSSAPAGSGAATSNPVHSAAATSAGPADPIHSSAAPVASQPAGNGADKPAGPGPAPSAGSGTIEQETGGQGDSQQPPAGNGNGNGNGGLGGTGWQQQQKGVVHAADATTASVSDKPFPTAIKHATTAAPSVAGGEGSGNGEVVEGIIEGPTPHIDAHRPPGGGRCLSKNGGQAKRSGRVDDGGERDEGHSGSLDGSPARNGPARHHKAKVSQGI